MSKDTFNMEIVDGKAVRIITNKTGIFRGKKTIDKFVKQRNLISLLKESGEVNRPDLKEKTNISGTYLYDLLKELYDFEIVIKEIREGTNNKKRKEDLEKTGRPYTTWKLADHWEKALKKYCEHYNKEIPKQIMDLERFFFNMGKVGSISCPNCQRSIYFNLPVVLNYEYDCSHCRKKFFIVDMKQVAVCESVKDE